MCALMRIEYVKIEGQFRGGDTVKKQLFVIGDIHGEISMLKKMLEHWKPETQQLLFLGDLIDRGENSKESLKYVRQLIEEKQAISLQGNHEGILANFLEQPDKFVDNYYINGGLKTIESLLSKELIELLKPAEMATEIKNKYPNLLAFLRNLPYYYEWHDYIFVHAGIDFEQKNWRDTAPRDFVWIREDFYLGENNTGKTIVFGHTPTNNLHKDKENSQIWLQDNKIGMDGGAVFGGTLHGIVFNKEKMLHHYGVKKHADGDSYSEVYL